MRVCFDTCVFLLICVCLCWCVYACVDTCVYMCWCMCVCLCWYMRVHVCVDACVLALIDVCLCACVYWIWFIHLCMLWSGICMGVDVCVYAYMCVWLLLMVLALCDSNACWMLDDCIWVLRNQKGLDAWVYYSFLVGFLQRTFWAIWRSGSYIRHFFCNFEGPTLNSPFDLLWLFNSIVTATFSSSSMFWTE